MPTQKELMEQASKDYGVGGSDTSFLRFEKSGEYKMRILTAGWPLATHFLGKGVKPKVCYGEDKGCPFHGENMPKDDEGKDKKPSVKFVCYAIDREDSRLKIAELPWTVIKAVSEYQEDEEFAFDDFPMPYDIRVTYNKEAAASEMYKVIPSRNNVELTEEEVKALNEKMEQITPEQYVEKRKEKQRLEDESNKQFDDPNYQTNQNQNAPDYPEEEINPEDIPF